MRCFATTLAVLTLSACTSTDAVRMHAASALRKGNHRDAFNAGDVRIAPNSELRFCRTHRGCSEWIEASELRVDDAGVWFDGVGYEWSEVDYCEVKGFDGIKTTGAIIGVTAGVAIIIPIALLAMSLKSLPRALPNDGPPPAASDDSGVSTTAALAGLAVAAATAKPAGDGGGLFYWGATRRRGATAEPPRLFSTAARVRSNITLGAFVDSGVAYERDLVTGGAVARLRLADFFEVGAGARVAHTKGMDGAWDTTRMYVVQAGFHSPVTARFALPLGVDVAWGNGELEREIRIPWGFRYTSPSGRWTGTFQPVTPSYAKRADADSGRWTITTGLELGVTF